MKRLTSIVLVTAFAVSCSTPDNNVASNGKDSKEAITTMTTAPIAGIREIETTTSTAAQVAETQAAAGKGSAGTSTNAGAGGSTTATSDQTVTTEEGKKRKKLNNTAKGIIIGLGAGAITGAAVDKNNRGKGAIIGAAVGAAAGGTAGAVMDHRQKQK
jgi:hypothetical protein